MRGTSDPGWRSALRRIAIGLIPFLGLVLLQRETRRGRIDGLTLTRVLFLSFGFALALILLVSVILVGGDVLGSSPRWLGVVLLVWGLANIAAVLFFRRRPLDLSNADQLAGSYRTVFFLQLAFAQSPALMGFVFLHIVGALWPLLVGLGFSAVGFALAAPTRGDIQRRQAEITAAGSPLSLLEALMAPPARS